MTKNKMSWSRCAAIRLHHFIGWRSMFGCACRPAFQYPLRVPTRCSACGLNQVGVRHAFRRFGYRDLSMRCFSALATLLDACVYIYEQAALMLLSPDARSDPPRPRRCAGPPSRRLQLHASAYPASRSEYAYARDR